MEFRFLYWCYIPLTYRLAIIYIYIMTTFSHYFASYNTCLCSLSTRLMSLPPYILVDTTVGHSCGRNWAADGQCSAIMSLPILQNSRSGWSGFTSSRLVETDVDAAATVNNNAEIWCKKKTSNCIVHVKYIYEPNTWNPKRSATVLPT